MENSNDTTGNRTRDFPACSAVPQPTAPPRAPLLTCSSLFSSHRIYPIMQLSFGARGAVVVKHYATNRQVAGSIPDGVVGIFQ